MDANNKHPQPSLRPMQDITPVPAKTEHQEPEKPTAEILPKTEPKAADVDIVAAPVEAVPGSEVRSEQPLPDLSADPQTTPPNAEQKPLKDADKELDSIVKEVNAEKAHSEKQDSKSSKPIMVAVIALVIAMLLGVVAFFAFKNTEESSTQKDTGQSQNATQQTTLSPEDLNTASKDIESSLNQFNDEQDFGAGEVSDQTLGL